VGSDGIFTVVLSLATKEISFIHKNDTTFGAT
jgi:hypothetical protein